MHGWRRGKHWAAQRQSPARRLQSSPQPWRATAKVPHSVCNRCRLGMGRAALTAVVVDLQLDLFVAAYFGVDHVYVVVAVACHRSLARRAANPVPRLDAMLITAGRPNFI
jgi:hypothetical protein